MVLVLFSILVVNRNSVWADEWSLWKDASTKAPREAQPFVYMGNFARARGELNQSAQLFEKALQRDSEGFTARANLADTYRLLGRLDEAAAMNESLAAQFPESSDVRYNLGRTYQDMGNSEGARRNYLSVDPASPHFHLALNNLGTVFENEGHLDTAVYYYGLALTAGEAQSADARANFDRIGSILGVRSQDLISRKAYAEAGKFCRQFLSIEPSHRDALFYLSVSLFLAGTYDESLTVNERLVSEHPEFGEGYLQLGNVLETVGRGSEAISVYRRLLTVTDDGGLRDEGSRRLSGLELEASK